MDSILHLYNGNNKVNNPGLGAKPVTTTIPDVTLSNLSHAKIISIWGKTLQFTTSFATVTNYRFNFKQSGNPMSSRVVYTSILNEESIKGYLEMDYNQWVQGCPEAIQG